MTNDKEEKNVMKRVIKLGKIVYNFVFVSVMGLNNVIILI